mmetsp:Transcript_3431/g.13866  ORF Transcript_3431/g.13866 Transcript_3431/m.13866 type:complete len:210 (-) Transcript_3431:1030-1659(-)
MLSRRRFGSSSGSSRWCSTSTSSMTSSGISRMADASAAASAAACIPAVRMPRKSRPLVSSSSELGSDLSIESSSQRLRLMRCSRSARSPTGMPRARQASCTSRKFSASTPSRTMVRSSSLRRLSLARRRERSITLEPISEMFMNLHMATSLGRSRLSSVSSSLKSGANSMISSLEGTAPLRMRPMKSLKARARVSSVSATTRSPHSCMA